MSQIYFASCTLHYLTIPIHSIVQLSLSTFIHILFCTITPSIGTRLGSAVAGLLSGTAGGNDLYSRPDGFTGATHDAIPILILISISNCFAHRLCHCWSICFGCSSTTCTRNSLLSLLLLHHLLTSIELHSFLLMAIVPFTTIDTMMAFDTEARPITATLKSSQLLGVPHFIFYCSTLHIHLCLHLCIAIDITKTNILSNADKRIFKIHT